ncbi:hypothetical protein D3C77_699730 [compost metagenome]
MLAAGAGEMTEAFKAIGLHDAMLLIPISLLLTMGLLFQASRGFRHDALAMRNGMIESAA